MAERQQAITNASNEALRELADRIRQGISQGLANLEPSPNTAAARNEAEVSSISKYRSRAFEALSDYGNSYADTQAEIQRLSLEYEEYVRVYAQLQPQGLDVSGVRDEALRLQDSIERKGGSVRSFRDITGGGSSVPLQ